jgi:hypothetical protein
MSEINRTQITTAQGFLRSVIYGHDKVTFDVRDGLDIAYADLTHKKAREYAQWVLDNVPEPHVQTMREFILTLEPGTMIHIPRTGGEFVILKGHRVLRTKLGPGTSDPYTRNNVGDSWPISSPQFDQPNIYEVM